MKKMTIFVTFSIIALILGLSVGLPAQKNASGKIEHRLADNLSGKNEGELVQLADPVNISKSGAPSGFPNLGLDRVGAAYITWIEYLGRKTFYFSTNRLGQFASPQMVEEIVYNAEEAGFPSMAVSKDGFCYLSFQDGRVVSYDIFLKAYESNSWGAPTNVSDNNGGSAYSGCAVSPTDGYVYVVWQDSTVVDWDIMGRFRAPGGSWGSGATLPVGRGYMPQIAIDASGTAHMVWMTRSGAGVWYSRNPNPKDPNAWTDIYAVRVPTYTEWPWPKIAVDNAGNAYVVWLDGSAGNQEVFLRRRTVDGTWHEPINISNTPGFSDEAAIGVNKTSLAVYVVWSENDEIYMNSYTGNNWSGPVNKSNSSGDSMQPSVAVDGSGVAHLVWSDNTTGNYDIYYLGTGTPPPPPPPPDLGVHPPVGLALETSLNDARDAKINTLTWYKNPVDKSVTIKEFQIYRKKFGQSDGEFVQIGVASGVTYRFDDANLPFNDKFTYAMLAVSSTGKKSDPSESIDEERIFAALDLSLKKVTNSSMFQTEKINVLTWSANPLNQGVTVAKYQIWRKKVDEDNSKWKVIADGQPNVFEYKDRRLSSSDRFMYGIKAIDSEGYASPASNIVQEDL